MAFRTDDVAAICFLEHCLNTYFGCFPVLHHLIPRLTPPDSPFYTIWFPVWHVLIPRFTPSVSPFYTPWFPVLHHHDSPFYTIWFPVLHHLIPRFTPPWFAILHPPDSRSHSPFPVPIPRSHSPFPFPVPIPRSHSPFPFPDSPFPVLKIAVDNTSFTWVRVEWSSVVIMFCPSVWCRVQIQVGVCRWSR